jgi:hypothetical protein
MIIEDFIERIQFRPKFCGESKTPSGVLLYILEIVRTSNRLKLPHNGELVMAIDFDDHLQPKEHLI